MKRIYSALFSAALFVFTSITLHAQTVLWPGTDAASIKNSQFDGGLNDWTTNGLISKTSSKASKAVWQWVAHTGSLGAYARVLDSTLISPSEANGAAMFSSDFLDNNGTQGAFGTGPAPAPNGGELISPTMNLTGQNNMLLKFNQFFRNFQTDSTYVTWSEDGGTTWKAPVPVYTNTLVTTNTSTSSNDVELVPLKGSKGTANFKVKFVYKGRYYVWVIDDVQLLTNANNIKIDQDFYAIPNRFTPASQVDSIPFLADISNQGNNNATNLQLTANISARSSTGVLGASLFTTTLNYPNMKGGDTIQNKLFPKQYLPPSTRALYYILYALKSDSANIGGNDTIVSPFTVTDTIFAKEDGVVSTITTVDFTGQTDHSIRVGNYFYCPNGKGYQASSCTFGISAIDSLKGQTIGVRLYKWVDTHHDSLIHPEDRGDPIGFNDWTVPTKLNGTTDTLLTLPLIPVSASAKQVTLDNKGEYLMMIEYENPKGATPDLFFQFNSNFDYSASVFASQQLGKPRYAGIIGTNRNSGIWPTATFSGVQYKFVPIVKLNIAKIASATNDLPTANKMEIYPNPTKDAINVDLDLVSASPELSLKIFDINGREVITRVLKNAQKESVNFDVRQFASGTYLMQVIAKDGVRTKKFVVSK